MNESILNSLSVTWITPARSSADSMPLGNGDVGLNVWVDDAGDVLFYMSKTDAWSQDCRLLKLGRMRISVRPNPFTTGAVMRQSLNLSRARVEVSLGQGDSQVTIWIWVDANRNTVHVEAQGNFEFNLAAKLELWRTESRELDPAETFSAYGLVGAPIKAVEKPDTLLVGRPESDFSICWYHRNETSMWRFSMEHQGLASLIGKTATDPLINRTFGGVLDGRNMKRLNETTIGSRKSDKRQSVDVHLLTAQTSTAQIWIDAAYRESVAAGQVELRDARSVHDRWWKRFWERSHIRILGDSADAFKVNQGYALQRFIFACAGRGEFPIKFNGSIFTADWGVENKAYDADYRAWGGPYWYQNTRLPYLAMLAAGDFDLMPPLFDMYFNQLKLSLERVKLYYSHGGAYFPETAYFWGGYADSDYGWKREGLKVGEVESQWIGKIYSNGLELIQLMLDFYAYTADEAFVRTRLVPIAREMLRFYDQHYPRDEHGKIKMFPAQSVETWQNVINPTPDIAGLIAVTAGLLALPAHLTTPEDSELWHKIQAQTPPLPTADVDGKRVIVPAAQILDTIKNCETPELYAVFPFRLFGLGRPNLELGQATYEARTRKASGGWTQDPIDAALLGFTEDARKFLLENFSLTYPGSRFPAFWGPNFDWIPDQDNGGVAMIALQTMLLQAVDEKLLVLPAWPRDWDVEFKLHGPGKTVVEGVVKGGKIDKIKVTPTSRKKNVVLPG